MDRAGARHGNLTPPRISPSCPHCLIPVLSGAVAGQEYHYWIAGEGREKLTKTSPQCETARHRLFYGRMGTALHLIWPSLMRRSPAQMVLAHPPMSLQPPLSGGLSPADVSKLPDMTAFRWCFSKNTSGLEKNPPHSYKGEMRGVMKYFIRFLENSAVCLRSSCVVW